MDRLLWDDHDDLPGVRVCAEHEQHTIFGCSQSREKSASVWPLLSPLPTTAPSREFKYPHGFPTTAATSGNR